MFFKHQWTLFLLAMSFFTRIPINLNEEITPEMLPKASRYFGLVGLIIGLLSAVIFLLLSFIFPKTIAVLLTMAFGLLLTGAFHEDGWADVWDGFGGGWQVTDKLNIMKDSRIGTYGAAALIVLLLIKFQSLTLVNSTVFALILAQCLSRVLATSLIFNMKYVSEDALTKVKPIAQHISLASLIVLITTGVLTIFALLYFDGIKLPNTQLLLEFTLNQALAVIIVLVVLRFIAIHWFNNQLGGYTGDCLGAAQQLSEVTIYLTLLAYQHYQINASLTPSLLVIP